MKRYPLFTFLVLLLALNSSARADDWTQAEAFSRALQVLPGGQDLPTQVSFDATEFHLAFVADSERLRFVEYVPAGQSLRRWRHMFSVFDHGSSMKPEQLLAEVRGRFERAGADANVVVLYASKKGDEHVFAYPTRSNDFIEFMLVHQRVEDGVTRARTYAQRIYDQDPGAIDAFRETMLANVHRWGEELRALPTIRAPAIGAYGNSMTFTKNGSKQGEVWLREQPSEDKQR